jgi:hypothetical protein
MSKLPEVCISCEVNCRFPGKPDDACLDLNEDKQGVWVKISGFGDGVIYARGDERKIVTPGHKDFKYSV